MTIRVSVATAVALLVLPVGAALGASRPCLKYEPAVTELTGTIRRTVFPGPPNWESVEQGDTPQVYWVLHLDTKVCVDADPRFEQNTAESEVTTLQLLIASYPRRRAFLGKRATVRGTLMHAVTAYHHTAVLLDVLEIRPPKDASSKPPK